MLVKYSAYLPVIANCIWTPIKRADCCKQCSVETQTLRGELQDQYTMYKKALIVSVLIAFICVQFASSLTCYTCTSANDCKSARKTTCSNAAANETSHYLGVYHNNVRNLNSVRFDCLALKYTFSNNNSISHQLHGCVHPDVSACTLPLKPQYSSWRKTKCTICSGDKCNKNPAGKMSSSLYTIVATVLALTLAKIYA